MNQLDFVAETLLSGGGELKPMPIPTDDDLKSLIFLKIWLVIRDWDVNVPEYYRGHCGANESHVKLILDAMQGGDKKRTPNDLMLFLIESIGNNNDIDGLNYQGLADDLIKEYPNILEIRK